MHVLEFFFGNCFFVLFLSFSYFCVKRPDDVSGCLDGEVVSSKRYLSLSGRAC
jgi:hypothetical protein